MRKRIQKNNYYCMDVVAGMKQHIKNDTVDLIIADPPYGINGNDLEQHYLREDQYVVEGYQEVESEDYDEFSRKWLTEAYRTLRPGGAIYVFSGYTHLAKIIDHAEKLGFNLVNHIIWKYNFGVYTKTKYVSSHYHVLYYEKPGGKRTFNLEARYGSDEKDEHGRSLNYADREDVWIINREYKQGQEKNRNELPMELLLKVVEYSSKQEDLVCDMFMGGFNGIKAAVGLGRKATGFEVNKEIFDKKTEEMRQLSPGHLLSTRRNVTKSIEKRRGQPWTDAELKNLKKKWDALIKKGATKQDAIQQLRKEFQRGEWAIRRAIKKLD